MKLNTGDKLLCVICSKDNACIPGTEYEITDVCEVDCLWGYPFVQLKGQGDAWYWAYRFSVVGRKNASV